MGMRKMGAEEEMVGEGSEGSEKRGGQERN